jgi:signal peptidase
VSVARTLSRVVGPVLLGVATVAVVVAGVCGVRLLPVLTGSMAPSAPAGSLVLTVPVAGEDVVEGDVLAFRPPAPYEVVDGRPVLHRVVEVDTDAEQPWMVTRGDANPQDDPWRVSLAGADLGRAVLVVPYAGRRAVDRRGVRRRGRRPGRWRPGRPCAPVRPPAGGRTRRVLTPQYRKRCHASVRSR